jgi:hypothetical protein
MNDKTLVRLVACVILAPVVWNGTMALVGLTAKGVNQVVYKHKIRKGLKDGSIVKIDGEYFEVEVSDIEEA